MNKIKKICFLLSYAVIINEVAWMGTENSRNDEWIAPQRVIYPSYLG